MFTKTAEFLFKHFLNISNDFKLIILTNSLFKNNYLNTELGALITKNNLLSKFFFYN